jgi:hypothetical protein
MKRPQELRNVMGTIWTDGKGALPAEIRAIIETLRSDGHGGIAFPNEDAELAFRQLNAQVRDQILRHFAGRGPA